MSNKPCSFCDYRKLTEVFYWDRWKNIIICRDLRDPGSKHRLLAVRVGKENHKRLPTVEERGDLMVPLIAVAVAQIANGRASGYDIEEVISSDHYHYFCNIK